MRLLKRTAPYEKLIFYQDICQIRRMIFKITEPLFKKHFKLVAQMRDAARSAKQNIAEGYRRGSIGEFIRGIKISQASLEELCGDVEDCFEDGLIKEVDFLKLSHYFRSADFMMARYLNSLYKIKSNGKWTNPGKITAPSRNASQPLRNIS